MHESHLVPLVHVGHIGLEHAQLGLGVAYQGAEASFVIHAQFIAEHRIDFLLDYARCRAQHVVKRIVLAVYISHKMLGTLGQVEYSLKVDDLGRCSRDRGETLGEQLQIFYASFHGSDVICANIAN